MLAAIVIAARAGSATAATIGNMRMTEQIDALDVMAIDSRQYLVSTRLLAAMIAVPIITALFSLAGIVAAFILATQVLGQEPGVFWGGVERSVEWVDISLGLKKSPGGSERMLRDGDAIVQTEPALDITQLLQKYAFGSSTEPSPTKDDSRRRSEPKLDDPLP